MAARVTAITCMAALLGAPPPSATVFASYVELRVMPVRLTVPPSARKLDIQAPKILSNADQQDDYAEHEEARLDVD